jgi:hypothetical protein
LSTKGKGKSKGKIPADDDAADQMMYAKDVPADEDAAAQKMYEEDGGYGGEEGGALEEENNDGELDGARWTMNDDGEWTVEA